MLPERRELRTKVRKVEPQRLIREDELTSSDTSPFDPIVIEDPDVRQALIRKGILRSGIGTVSVRGFSSNHWE